MTCELMQYWKQLVMQNGRNWLVRLDAVTMVEGILWTYYPCYWTNENMLCKPETHQQVLGWFQCPHSGSIRVRSLHLPSSRGQRRHWDQGWRKHDGGWNGMRNVIDIWHSTGARLVACCQVVVGGRVGRSCDRGKDVQCIQWWPVSKVSTWKCICMG